MNNTRFAYLCVLLISLPFLAPFYRHGPLAFSLRSERPVRRFCGAVHESPRSQPRLPSRKSFRLPSHTSIPTATDQISQSILTFLFPTMIPFGARERRTGE